MQAPGCLQTLLVLIVMQPFLHVRPRLRTEGSRAVSGRSGIPLPPPPPASFPCVYVCPSRRFLSYKFNLHLHVRIRTVCSNHERILANSR
jgi:hypothetical protein